MEKTVDQEVCSWQKCCPYCTSLRASCRDYRLLGKLQFAQALAKMYLHHSIEVSHIMGLIAAELFLDEKKARRIGLCMILARP